MRRRWVSHSRPLAARHHDHHLEGSTGPAAGGCRVPRRALPSIWASSWGPGNPWDPHAGDFGDTDSPWHKARSCQSPVAPC